MAEVTAEEIGKLRELVAECQPVEGVMPNGDVGTLTEVALSALDALEAANTRIECQGQNVQALYRQKRAALASRDQAIKERDRLAETASNLDHFAVKQMDGGWRVTNDDIQALRAALAGVPGGEEA